MRNFIYSAIFISAAVLLLGGCDEKNPPVITEEPEDPVLEVVETPIKATAAADDYTIDVESNGEWNASVEYDIEPATGWITLEGGSGENNGTITLKLAANTEVATREAVIVITMGELERNVPVEQYGVDVELAVSTPAIDDVVAAGESFPITVTSNHTWTATEESDFISLTDPSGTGNGTFTITVDANTLVDPRDATVTVTPDGGEPATITIHQLGVDVVMGFDLGGDIPEFEAEGGDVDVNITANIKWTAISSENFASLAPASGTGDGTVKITVAENEDTEPRTAIITLAADGRDGVAPVTMEISQAGAIPPIKTIVINNVEWAASNLVAYRQIGTAMDEKGCLFQYNSPKAWANTGEVDASGWLPAPASGDRTPWAAENDPCPEGFRMPTRNDFTSLPYNTPAQRYKVDDGGWWFGPDAAALQPTVENPQGCIFFPVTGTRGTDPQTVTGSTNSGFYWASTTEDYRPNGQLFSWANNGTAGPTNKEKNYACAVRCVKIK